MSEDDHDPKELWQRNAGEFIEFAMSMGVLSFGKFTTKAERLSPFYFNAGLFNDGLSISILGEFYARRLLKAQRNEGFEFDMLFGSAYKGIQFVVATSMKLAENRQVLPYVYNRKEAKDHGEGGVTIGASLSGRVLIIDDVVSAGTSVRESVGIIRSAGAEPAGVLIALDRQERGEGELSAVQEVSETYGIPVFSIASLEDIITYLELQKTKPLNPDVLLEVVRNLHAVLAYKAQYGVAP